LKPPGSQVHGHFTGADPSIERSGTTDLARDYDPGGAHASDRPLGASDLPVPGLQEIRPGILIGPQVAMVQEDATWASDGREPFE
jgi:hypothetical protein